MERLARGGAALGHDAYALAEELSLTTYYPSPKGAYQTLSSTSTSHFATYEGGVGIGTADPGTAKLAVMGGDVGIGTTTPDSLRPGSVPAARAVSITPDLSSDGQWTDINIRGRADNGGTVARLNFQNTASNYNIAAIGVHGDGTANSGRMSFWTMNNGAYVRAVDIDKAGNVGIGTMSPGAPLEIYKTTDGTLLRLTRHGVANWDFRIEETSPYGLRPGSLAIVPGVGNTDLGIGIQGSGTGLIGLVVKNSGNVGIGTADPLDFLHVAKERANNGTDNLAQIVISGSGATGDRLLLGYNTAADNGFIQSVHNAANYTSLLLNPNGGNVGIGRVPSSTYKLDVAGDILANTTSYPSDARLKANIQPLSGVLERLQSIRAVTFEWNEAAQALGYASRPGRQIGLLAQEVGTVFPEIVSAVTEENSYRGLDYSRLTAVLLEAIKEQQAQIEELRARLTTLESTQ